MIGQGKPSWDDAPYWANYLAMDEDGSWYWYSIEPVPNDLGQWMTYEGKAAKAANSFDWQESKEQKPTQ